MAIALKLLQVTDQEFTAPDMAIGTVTDPVKNNPNGRFTNAVFGQAAGQVRMMMLDCDCRQPAFFQSIACRIVIGVQIVRDPLWFDFEKPAHVTNRIPERFIDLEVFQVSDVLAQKSAVAAGQADGVLQLRTDSQYGPAFTGQGNASWDKST